MQRLFAILLLFVFLCHTFMFMVIRLNFEANREVLAELFCENKDQPITVCYGSCFLKKELEKAADTQEKGAESNPGQILMDIHPKLLTEVADLTYSFLNEGKETPYINHYQYLFAEQLLDPPNVKDC